MKSSVVEQVLHLEGEKLLAAAHPPLIALDRQGIALNTGQLAKQLQNWHDGSQSPCLLIGGPEGLSPSCLQRADKVWSLSALTFPHPLVRIILAEQILSSVEYTEPSSISPVLNTYDTTLDD